MNIKKFGWAAVLLAGTAMISGQSDSKDRPAMPGPEEMQKMMEGMKKWQESMTPGPQHAYLNQFVGTWKTTTRMWMGGPGSPPMETEGTATFEWTLGKRFLLQQYEGTMLMPTMTGAMQKLPYEGMGMMGYDNVRNLYTSTWASTAGTHVLVMNGSVDPSGKVFRMFGEMDEPMLNVYGRMVEYVTRVINTDKFVFEIIDLHAADDYKVIEITYSRK